VQSMPLMDFAHEQQNKILQKNNKTIYLVELRHMQTSAAKIHICSAGLPCDKQ